MRLSVCRKVNEPTVIDQMHGKIGKIEDPSSLYPLFSNRNQIGLQQRTTKKVMDSVIVTTHLQINFEQRSSYLAQSHNHYAITSKLSSMCRNRRGTRKLIVLTLPQGEWWTLKSQLCHWATMLPLIELNYSTTYSSNYCNQSNPQLGHRKPGQIYTQRLRLEAQIVGINVMIIMCFTFPINKAPQYKFTSQHTEKTMLQDRKLVEFTCC